MPEAQSYCSFMLKTSALIPTNQNPHLNPTSLRILSFKTLPTMLLSVKALLNF